MTQDVINRISLSPTEKIVARATCQVSDLPKSTNVWEISGSLMKRLSRSPGSCTSSMCGGLRLQEAGLPVGAAGAGSSLRRHGG